MLKGQQQQGCPVALATSTSSTLQQPPSDIVHLKSSTQGKGKRGKLKPEIGQACMYIYTLYHFCIYIDTRYINILQIYKVLKFCINTHRMSENFQSSTVPELQNGVPALEMLLQAGLARGTIAADCRRLSKVTINLKVPSGYD